MNEFTARKIGEVLAFAQVGGESLAKGKAGFVEAFGADAFAKAQSENMGHAEEIMRISQNEAVRETVLAKAEKTAAKLRAMRELYLKEDDWQDATELLEWSGFFEGAAIIHWTLVAGAADKSGSMELKALADRGATMHHDLLHRAGEAIRARAEEKA